VCDVPSIAAFFGQSVECFPVMTAKLFLKTSVTVPVAPINTGII